MTNFRLLIILAISVLLMSCDAELVKGDTWIKDYDSRDNPFKPDRFDKVTIIEVKEDWVRVESSDHRYTQDRRIPYFKNEYDIEEKPAVTVTVTINGENIKTKSEESDENVEVM